MSVQICSVSLSPSPLALRHIHGSKLKTLSTKNNCQTGPLAAGCQPFDHGTQSSAGAHRFLRHVRPNSGGGATTDRVATETKHTSSFTKYNTCRAMCERGTHLAPGTKIHPQKQKTGG